MGPSEIARKIAGTYIEDSQEKKPPVFEWVQAECRAGYFRQAIDKFVQSQPEPFRPDLAVVEKLDPDRITFRLPCRVSDHESTSTFAADCLFEINPLTLDMKRL